MVTFPQALAYLACSRHVAVLHDHKNSSFACIFKHLWFKNKWLKRKKQHYMCKLSVSERAFCNWVGSSSGHIHTLNEPYQSSFGSGPRPSLQLGLSSVVWSAPECDCCIHTCPKYPHQEGKPTWVLFNRTKQDRCQYTLIYMCFKPFPGSFKLSFDNLYTNIWGGIKIWYNIYLACSAGK